MARRRGSARSKYGGRRSCTSSKRSAQLRRSSIEGNTSISSSFSLVSLSLYHISAAVVLEAVRKGQRSHFPLLGFHWLLEPLALQAKAHLNKNISYWLLEWLARANQLINATCSKRLFVQPLLLHSLKALKT